MADLHIIQRKGRAADSGSTSFRDVAHVSLAEAAGLVVAMANPLDSMDEALGDFPGPDFLQARALLHRLGEVISIAMSATCEADGTPEELARSLRGRLPGYRLSPEVDHG